MNSARCAGCGRFTNNVHVDHIHPKSRGGTDDPENFQLLCAECNLSKSWKTMREWVLVPNARCRSFWAGREHLAPIGKSHGGSHIQEVSKAALFENLFKRKIKDPDDMTLDLEYLRLLTDKIYVRDDVWGKHPGPICACSTVPCVHYPGGV